MLKRTTISRKLLEARRTQDEFESAKGEYEKTCQRLRMVLNTWVREEQEQKKLCRQQLEAAYKSLNAHTLIQRALQTALQSWEMAFQGPSFMMDGDRPLFYDDLESPIQTDVELTDRVSSIVYDYALNRSHRAPSGPPAEIQTVRRRVSSLELPSTSWRTPQVQDEVCQCYTRPRRGRQIVKNQRSAERAPNLGRPADRIS